MEGNIQLRKIMIIGLNFTLDPSLNFYKRKNSIILQCSSFTHYGLNNQLTRGSVFEYNYDDKWSSNDPKTRSQLAQTSYSYLPMTAGTDFYM